MNNHSNRCVVLRSECKSMDDFTLQVQRWLRIASPKSVYYLRYHGEEPDALILAYNGQVIKSLTSGHTYIKVKGRNA